MASVCAISLRFALYSASLAPYLQRARKRTLLAMALTLIEEGYGVTLSKLSGGEKDWDFRHAVALNVVTAAAWFASVAAGAGVAVALAATRGEAQARMAGPQDADALRGDAQRGGDAA